MSSMLKSHRESSKCASLFIPNPEQCPHPNPPLHAFLEVFENCNVKSKNTDAKPDSMSWLCPT